MLARGDELGCVGRDRELEDGRGPRLREPARDRLARRRELDDLDLGARSGRGGCRTRLRLLHVLGDHASFGPGPGDLRKVDPALARDATSERARLHVLAGGTRRRLVACDSLGAGARRGVVLGRRLRRLGGLSGGLLGRRVAVLHGRRHGGLGRRGRVAVPTLGAGKQRGDVLVLRADDPHGGSDVHLTVGDHDLEQDAVGLGLDLLRHLVGVELVERLALRHRVTLGLEPTDDRPRLHALAQARELDLGRHC